MMLSPQKRKNIDAVLLLAMTIFEFGVQLLLVPDLRNKYKDATLIPDTVVFQVQGTSAVEVLA